MQEKETRVKFNPTLSANRPSNNWALSHFKSRLSLIVRVTVVLNRTVVVDSD